MWRPWKAVMRLVNEIRWDAEVVSARRLQQSMTPYQRVVYHRKVVAVDLLSPCFKRRRSAEAWIAAEEIMKANRKDGK